MIFDFLCFFIFRNDFHFMKKSVLLVLFTLILLQLQAVDKFSFAFLTDLHIQLKNNQPAIDLENIVADVNKNTTLSFVLVGGDITESGDLPSLQRAKEILQKLRKPFYIVSGNHDTKWSESGATDFVKVFGYDRFCFESHGICFVGFNTGPVIKMGDGHISPYDVKWIDEQLKKLPTGTPVIAVTHYPLQNGDVDNWILMTDMLRNYNVQAVLNGHYHRNALLSYDGLPGIVNRSTLSAGKPTGGYSVYQVNAELEVSEAKPGEELRSWLKLPLDVKKYDAPDKSLRPSGEMNSRVKKVKIKWTYKAGSSVFTTPVVAKDKLYFGDDLGNMVALKLSSGQYFRKTETGSRIISSPAVSSGKLVFASTNGGIYCFDVASGREMWQMKTPKAVLGCPEIKNDTVYIGGSDGCFRAIDLKTGKQLWAFNQLKGYVESKPVIANGKVIFGAWDTNLYALNCKTGELVWKWNNGNVGIHYSPAAVCPVVSGNKVFIVAPDRFFTALDVETGAVIWRTNKHEVRESIGISEDKKTVFARCMNDSVVAMDATSSVEKLIWKTSAAFGYDINSCMLTENKGTLLFGTKNGLITAMDAKTGKLKWQYKFGNSIVNTIVPLRKNECIFTTTDGYVVRMKY